MATHTYWAGKSPPGSSAARTQRRVNRPLPYNPATHGGAGRTGLRRRPEQQTQHAGERRPRDAADAGGRRTRRTHAPLGSTLGSLAVGELRGDSWRFWSPAQRSRRSRWAAGGALAVHQSGSTVWCAQPNANPTRQPTHELTVSTGTENSDRYGTASDEMRCGLSSGTLMHSPSSQVRCALCKLLTG